MCCPFGCLCLVASSEKDLDEVLQSETIFANVSKGMVASQADLMAAFGTDDVSAIAPMVRRDGVCATCFCDVPLVDDSLCVSYVDFADAGEGRVAGIRQGA